MDRRLAAILAMDMVGYSRLMEADEEDVLARQTAHFEELINPSIQKHRGRVVKTTGDGLLAEFSSAVEAVICAVEIQRDMPQREEGVKEDRRISFRFGINLRYWRSNGSCLQIIFVAQKTFVVQNFDGQIKIPRLPPAGASTSLSLEPYPGSGFDPTRNFDVNFATVLPLQRPLGSMVGLAEAHLK